MAPENEDVIDTLERYVRDLRRILHFGYDEPEDDRTGRGVT